MEVDILWGLSESIGVYGKGMLNSKFVSTNKWSKTAAPIFSGNPISSPQYAYYPYSSENNGKGYNEVRGNLPLEQSYSTTIKKMRTDYKIATIDSRSFLGYKFNFKHILTFVRFDVNATGTEMQGETLISVSMEINKPDGTPRQLGGGFTMDLSKNPSESITSWDAPIEESNTITLTLEDQPKLTANKTIRGYVSVAPVVCKGDKVKFIITTENHIAEMTVEASSDYRPDGLVDYDLILSDAAKIELIPTDTPEDDDIIVSTGAPIIRGFKFEVAKNPGRILSTKVYYDSGSKTTKRRNDISEEILTIDQSNHTITAYIPYLHNRKLIPTFDIPEGMGVITKDGKVVISGETVVDFSVHNQLAVVNTNYEMQIYDIILENTGLPVVVVNQKSGVVTSESGDYQRASTAWYNATGAAWQPKESDWQMTEGVDNFMVYNADGTSAVTDKSGAIVNEPLLASTRVRGNVSQQMPKKPFAIKLDKKSGVLGMDPHKRWVLLANWSDRTLMRNAVAFDIAKIFNQTFPTDGIAWNPSGQFVELVYNGVHVGNYFLCEQIKIDGSRLDISDPYDKDDAYSGNPADYGYLLESDDAYDETVKFITKTYIPFQFKDDADAGGAMLSYVKGIVNGIDENLYNGNWDAAYASLDLTSAVDFWLIQELTMNGEVAHPKSCYSYIVDNMLHMGPIWDFDWQTFPNVSVVNQYYDNMYTGGSNSFKYEYSKSMLSDGTFSRSSSNPSSVKTNDKSYMWYPMLVKDATFKAKAAERWNAVKGFIAAYADSQIPAMAAKIKKSEAENWSMWPLESGSSAARNRYNTYGLGGGFKGDEAMTFDNAVSTLSSTINTRISGMSYVSNQNWPSVSGTPSYSGSSSSGSNGSGSSWWPW